MGMTWWQRDAAEAPAQAEAGIGAAPLDPRLSALLRDVEDAFTARTDPTPGWADPYRDAQGSRDIPKGAYNRVTQPERYEIIAERIDAWLRVLTARGAARTEKRVEWLEERPREIVRCTVVSSPRPGTSTLVVGVTAVDVEDSLAWHVIGVAEPTVALATLPDCGCDACDEGSDALLEDVDRAILGIVDGSCEVWCREDGSVGMADSFGAQWTGELPDGAPDASGSSPGWAVHARTRPWFTPWSPRTVQRPVSPERPLR